MSVRTRPTVAAVIRSSRVEPERWRNGLGWTRVVMERHTRPAPATDAGLLWRVSIADITDDGPFSTFPGLDRQLLLCSDRPVVLQVDGVSRRLTRLEVASFAGEAETSASLEHGAAVAFNVMTRRGDVRADLAVLAADDQVLDQPVPDGSECLLVAMEDQQVTGPDGRGLNRWDAVHCPAGSTPAVDGSGSLVAVVFSAPSGSMGSVG